MSLTLSTECDCRVYEDLLKLGEMFRQTPTLPLVLASQMATSNLSAQPLQYQPIDWQNGKEGGGEVRKERKSILNLNVHLSMVLIWENLCSSI